MTDNNRPGDDPSRVRVLQWSLTNGYMTMTYPDGLSLAEIADVEAVIAINIGQMRRRAENEEARRAALTQQEKTDAE